jgi:hypothetical protein
MTRACYAQIARVTGVPVDATRRDLKVAWDSFALLDECVLEELRFWIRNLPGHTGTAIHPQKVRAQIVLAQDAGDNAWAGFLDAGDGVRHISRNDLHEGEGEESSSLREVKACERHLDTFASQVAALLRKAEMRLKQRAEKHRG